MKKYQHFLSENVQCLEVKLSIYLNRHVFVMSGFCIQETYLGTRTPIFLQNLLKDYVHKGPFLAPSEQIHLCIL